MNFKQLKEITKRYLAGNASASETELINQWLDEAEIQARQIPDEGLLNDRKAVVLNNLRQLYRQTESQAPGRIVRLRKTWMAAAACIIIPALLLTAWWYRFALLDVIDPVPLQKIVSGSYEVMQIQLPDSSVITLNTGSELVYPTRFRGKQRTVQLKGEAFFNVTHNRLKPFIVKAEHLQVQVLGTSFMVSDNQQQAQATVQVKTGKVRVTPPTDNESAVLIPDDQLTYNKTTKNIQVLHHIQADLSWTDQSFIFRETPLANVFKAIQEKYGVPVQVKNTAILSLTFTGSFGQKDTLQDVLNILSLSYNFTIAHHNNKIVIQ